MTAPHVLVIQEPYPDAADAVRLYAIECPYAAEGPQAHWGKCAYLEPCGCDQAFERDNHRFIELTRAIWGEPGERELEKSDWLDGCFIALDGAQEQAERNPTSSLRLTVEAHEDCPERKLAHQEWEGEIMTQTGECSLRGMLREVGPDIGEWMTALEPGRYPVKGTWDHEDFYLERIEDPQPPEETTNA